MATIVVREGTVLPDRIPHDHYETPEDFVVKGLQVVERAVALGKQLGLSRPCFASDTTLDWHPRILDPGAGAGRWGAQVRNFWEWTPKEIVGVEIRNATRPEAYDRWHRGDFLSMTTSVIGRDYDIVLGNPPYKFAEPFVRNSLCYAGEGGIVTFLFYLTFLESERRGSGLFQDHPPLLVSVSKKRPNFTGKGNPNAACFVTWLKGYEGMTVMEWI